jgi:hypothetical protein
MQVSKKELNQLKIKDTYPDFLSCWNKVEDLSTMSLFTKTSIHSNLPRQ